MFNIFSNNLVDQFQIIKVGMTFQFKQFPWLIACFIHTSKGEREIF
jgi:hypothetical protein